MTEKTVSIDLPTDGDGMLPRQCPNCQAQFAIHEESYSEEHYLNLRCTYCEWIEKFDEFLTDEQADYAQAVAENEARQLAAKELEDALGDVFDSSGDIEFDDCPEPSPHLSVEMQRVVCDECGFIYSVQKDPDEVSCPVCR